WAARTSDIDAAAQASPLPLGAVEPITRGPLKWKITIPDDGMLVMGGIAPALIQWATEPHPASLMEDIRCSLLSLEAFPPDTVTIQQWLDQIGFDDKLQVFPRDDGSAPYMIAHIQTPSGPKQLDSRRT